MMTPQQLKNSILQRAIEGKLVEQRPEEGNAKELLKQIKAEKDKLTKEGKIKKTKPLPPITEDEIPFEIPESWEWVRLGGVFLLQAGKNIKAQEIATYPDKKHEFLCYGGNGIRGYVAQYNREGNYPLIGRQGALCGNIHLAQGKFYATEHAVVTDTFAGTDVIWAKYFLVALNLNQYATATAQPGLAVNKVEQVLIPLPPLPEQHRIVAKIEELMPLVDEYDKAYSQLTALNEKFPADMKKSILQYAIEGKLVEQRPEEGTAADLLEQIKAEKAKLIKEGKIKKEKTLPPITEDEIPFEIPDSWEWVRFDEFGIYKKGPFGSALTKSIFVPKSDDTIKVYEQKNAIQKDASLGDYYITKQYFEKYMTGFELDAGDIIVSCAGTIGETFIIPSDFEKGIINQALMRMRLMPSVYVPFFLLYFDFILKETARKSSKGSALKNIPPFAELKKYLVPLPPLSEQHRIVAKIEQLLLLCEKLAALE